MNHHSSLNKPADIELLYHRIPDDVFLKLSQAKMFTIINFKKGYDHIDLDKASSFLTTFNVPYGRFRITRMPFKFTVAGYAFQYKLDAVFINLGFCTGIADDVIIWEEQLNSSDNDQHLTEFLQVTRKHNLAVSISKLQYRAKHTSFFRSKFTFDDHKPENENLM